MRRRVFLGIAAGAAAGLAGCTASALPSVDPAGGGADATDCPTPLDVERSVCAGAADGPLAVERSSASVSGESWSLVVTVANRSGATLGFNPHAWSVFRREGERWEHVAPDAHIEPWQELAPEASYAWELTAAEAGRSEADQRVFLDPPPGTYAFTVGLDGEERLAAVATFDVVD